MEQNREKSVEELYKDIDINFINHNIMFWGKTPAFALYSIGLFIIPLMISGFYWYLGTLIVVVIIYKTSKNLHKEGYHSPRTILDIIKYIYKPRFYFLKNKKL
jgi:hypothetical protein